MLEEIGTIDRIPEFIAKAKDKVSGFHLMGFGHRVYKHYDPRAKVMQKTCHQVLDEPMLKVAIELERIALQDDYFIEKRLYPNKDPASRYGRWVSPCPCSPCCSRWRGRSAGLRSGKR